MGNHPSSEKSVRIPQKLPKPRVAGAVSTVSPPEPSSTNQHSNSYLTDPPRHSDLRSSKQAGPRLKDQPKPRPQGGRDGAPIDSARRRSGIDQFPALPHPQDGSVKQQRATGLRNNDATDGSMAISGNFPTAMRGQHSPLNQSDRCRSAQNETTTFDSLHEQKVHLENKTSDLPRPVDDRKAHQGLVQGHIAPGVLSRPVGRTQSDASLYIPIRRRSTTETPGVATRLEPPTKATLVKKKDSRTSLPPAFSSFNFEEYANQVKRRLSTPPPFTGPENSILVETPSENEYKQLGVMKFGSLRIINGTPVSTPGGVVSNSASSGEGRRDDYFQQHRTTNLGSMNANIENPGGSREEPAERQPPTTAKESSHKTFNDKNTSAGNSARPDSDFWPMVPGTTPRDENPVNSVNDSGTHANISAKSGQPKTGPRVNRADSGVSLKHSPVRPDYTQQTDSGYSSTISLRSIFGSKKKRDREAEQKAAEKEKAERARTRREELPNVSSAQPAGRLPPSSQTPLEKPVQGTERLHHGSSDGRKSNVNPQAIPSAPPLSSKFSVQRSRSISTHSGDVRIQANVEEAIPRRSQELSRSTSRGRLRAESAGSVQQGHEKSQRGTQPTQAQHIPHPTTSAKSPTRTRSNSTRSGEHGASKKSAESSTLPKPTKFERLFGTRRRSLPDVHSTQIPKTTTPPMPSDAQDKLREHASTVPGKSGDQKRQLESGQKEPGVSKPSHLSRAASILVPKSKSRSPDKQRFSKKSEEEDDDMDSESLVGYEAHVASLASIRKSAGNSAFDQAFVPLSVEYDSYTEHERNVPPSNLKLSKHSKQPRLRTRRSAPEFLETVRESGSFSGLESSLESLSKAPPPVSLHTRGAKKKRRSKHHSSSRSKPPISEFEPVPPLPPALSNGQAGDESDPHRQYLSHSLRTIPIASAQRRRCEQTPQSGPDMPTSRHKSMPPHGSSRSGRSRPYFPKAGLEEPSLVYGQCASDINLSASSQGELGESRPDGPPYRVLHSYNSPSYRGVPIWSS